MKFTLEHALILILSFALIYYVIQHRNLVKDVLSIPNKDHPELKRVKDQHSSNDVDCSKNGTFYDCNKNDKDILSYCGKNPNASWDDCWVTNLSTPVFSMDYTYKGDPITIKTGGDVWCNKQWFTNADRGAYIVSTSLCHFPFQEIPGSLGTEPEYGKVASWDDPPR